MVSTNGHTKTPKRFSMEVDRHVQKDNLFVATSRIARHPEGTSSICVAVGGVFPDAAQARAFAVQVAACFVDQGVAQPEKALILPSRLTPPDTLP